jgi:TolB protein
VSLDGSRIAFVSGGDIYVIRADGTGAVQLTHTPEEEASPAWTRGGKITYSVFANNASRLFVVDADGRNARVLATVPGRAPVLSPDESRVIYWTGSWTSTRLLVATLDGSVIRQVTDGSSIAWNSQWSPDGRQIAYTGRDAGGILHVFVMNADGSGRRQLTRVPRDEGEAQVPAWSPDGHQIAFQTTPAKGKPGHIWIADAETGVARKVAAHAQPYVDEVPAWFPDGTRLAFQSNRTHRMEIWVMNANGSGARQITRSEGRFSPETSSEILSLALDGHLLLSSDDLLER